MMSYRAGRVDGEVSDLVMGCGLLVVVPNYNVAIGLLGKKEDLVKEEEEEKEVVRRRRRRR